MLDPDHFLGLKPQRLTIFEDERDERPDGNPAPLLERDDLRAELLPLPFIVGCRDNRSSRVNGFIDRQPIGIAHDLNRDAARPCPPAWAMAPA